MSRSVATLVYQKKFGSMAKKAIMAYCADRANDDGSGIWTSKSRISREVECSKQTVIQTMRDLVAEGLLIESGQRRTTNGFVVVYDIAISAVKALPNAVADDELTGPILDGSNFGRVKPVDPTSQIALPDGSTSLTPPVKPLDPNRPLTVLEPSFNRPPAAQLTLMAEEEVPKPIDRAQEFWDAYPKCKRKIDRAEAVDLFRRIVSGRHRKIPKTDPDVIIAATRRFAVSGDDPEFMPLPTTWLNKARWEQFPAPSDEEMARQRAAAVEAERHHAAAEHGRQDYGKERPVSKPQISEEMRVQVQRDLAAMRAAASQNSLW